MRNLYMYYKRLKQYIEKREKMESAKGKQPQDSQSEEKKSEAPSVVERQSAHSQQP